MSETIADHGYLPEEHAPDPVAGHGDPTPPGKIGIWLFLASEVMFFIGILGSYIILRSGSHDLFSKMAQVLSKPMAGANTIVLIFSSLTMALAVDGSQKGNRPRVILCLLLTFLCACGFMVIKSFEYHHKWVSNTIVARDQTPGSNQIYVYDGEVEKDEAGVVSLKDAWRAPLPIITAENPTGAFDLHLVSPQDVREAKGAKQDNWEIKTNSIVKDGRLNYFPWRNMFFACYFTLTGVHGVHVIGGMIPIFFLLVQAMRGKLFPAQTEYVGLYWHFVDLVWIFLFPLLYLI